MRIPLAAVFAVQVVVSLIGVAVIVAVLVTIQHDAAIASAKDLTRAAAKYMQESVAAPFDTVVPQVESSKNSIAMTDAWCSRSMTNASLEAALKPDVFRTSITAVESNPVYFAVYQTYRMPHPDPDKTFSNNNSDYPWSDCGCFSDDPNLCFWGGFIGPAEGHPANTTATIFHNAPPTSEPYNASAIQPFLSAPHAPRYLPYGKFIMGLTRVDSAGRWGVPDLLPLAFLNTVVSYITFSIPVKFDAVTGYAIDSFNADVSLTWLASFLDSEIDLAATRTAIVDLDSRYVLAHTFGAPALRYPNASDQLTAFFWTMDDVPDADLQHALRASGLAAANTSSLADVVVVEGDDFMYGASRIRSRSLNLATILVTRKSFYLESGIHARNVSIGVGVAVFVLLAAAVAATTVAVVTPIRTVAENVRVAADFVENDAGLQQETSVLAEVAELQEAYLDLTTELKRVRGFVPQAVLLRYDGQEEDVPADETTFSETGSQRSRSHASRRSANSRGRSTNQASRKSSEGVSAAAAAAMLSLGLKPQSATVVVSNLTGFVAHASQVSRDRLVGQMDEVVTRVVELVRGVDGVLASFHGDHFVTTFNAARPCASHARRGCTLATELAVEIPATGMGLAIRSGVATGRCLVGNLGSDAAKASAAVGGTYTRASLLERMCRLYNLPVLVASHTAQDVQGAFRAVYVDAVKLPVKAISGSSKGMLKHSLIATVLPRERRASSAGAAPNQPGNGDGEWLYVLDGQGAGATAAHNAKFIQTFDLAVNEPTKPVSFPAAEAAGEAAEDSTEVPAIARKNLAELIDHLRSKGLADYVGRGQDLLAAYA
uniref:Guanylate cyclase domain-containing protein n=1 Tax=Neobodo designis TaxID=312471 RepID=A0A7S1QBG3_NEODS|mmetsp:Transcript_37667/g.116371  ORF Transcript_37667/g.116371 Transcript_37667/m.116371 type:complete len:830 (+) Transcript_37667:130-2619(+)